MAARHGHGATCAFEEWECALGRMQLASGDLLVAYSDGVTEARNGGEHSARSGWSMRIRSHADAPPDLVIAGILERVQSFSAGDQSDDLTLLVARLR